MQTVTITREKSEDYGTFGVLSIDDTVETFITLELPDKGNEPGKSCIPAGKYTCVKNTSRKGGFRLLDVPGRENILIHVGNFAGDTMRGYQSDVEGCILVGMRRYELINRKGKKQPIVSDSRIAMSNLEALLTPPFTLIIN
jgi:hypothetical protein